MFYRTVLSNGLRIIGETMPFYRSLSAGLWVASGSLWEDERENGISHFIEHMAFKGTSRYTTRQMAEAMDGIGGLVNAFTARECTCFYGKTLPESAEKLIDILSDMVISPLYVPEELERERGVVLEEIGMAEDTPEDVAGDLLQEAMYGACTLARPILGSPENVQRFDREEILRYRDKHYRPAGCVLSLAGNFDWEKLVALAEKYFGTWEAKGGEAPALPENRIRCRSLYRRKSIEQTHICLGWEGLSVTDELSYELSLLSGAFGGASSSRLFQKIREEMAIAYTVYSDAAFYPGSGVFSVYAAVSPENTDRVRDAILTEAERLARDGFTKEEFDAALVQMRSGFLIEGESTSAHMQANGRRLLLEDEVASEDEVLEKIDHMRFDDVNALAARLLTGPRAEAVVGRRKKVNESHSGKA